MHNPYLVPCFIMVKIVSFDMHSYMQEGLEAYRITDCEVPRGHYDLHPANNDLDAARLTIHDEASNFFEPVTKTMDRFCGTDCCRADDGFGVMVYVNKDIPCEEVEAFVMLLAEKFGVPETADAR